MFTYKFSLHSDTFLKKNSMECAKALALQAKPKKKMQNLIMSPDFYSLSFIFFLCLFFKC